MKYALLVFSFFVFAACTPNTSKQGQEDKFSRAHIHEKKAMKSRGYLNLKLSVDKQDGTHMLLIAEIMPNQDMPESSIVWEVPDHIPIVAGDLEKEVNLKAGEPFNAGLTLDKSGMKEGDVIFVFAHQYKDGERLGTSASFKYQSEEEKAAESDTKSFKMEPSKKKKMIQ